MTATVDLTPTTVPPTRYRYLAAATSLPLVPDAVEDSRAAVAVAGRLAGVAGDRGWIGASPGSPFEGRTIGWKALAVKDSGVDLECEWDDAVFVDRVLVDPAVLAAVSRIRVLVPVGERLRQVGQLDLSDLRRDETVLEGPGPIGLDVGQLLRRCVIRFETSLIDLILTGGLTIVGTEVPPVGLFPAPKASQLSGDGPGVSRFAEAVLRPYGHDAAVIVDHGVGRAAETFGQTWSAAAVASGSGLTGEWSGLEAIMIDLGEHGSGEDDPGAILTRHLSGIEPGGAPAPGPEGFALFVESDRLLVVGDRRGLRHGVESVLQQLILDGCVQAGWLVDQPAHGFRGVHLPLPGPSQVDYFRRLIRWLVVPARFNSVIIEVAGGMEFTRHPEINQTWQDAHARALAGEIPMPGHFSMVAPGECLSQSTTAELADELRALDLDVIPEVQSLSHVQYLTLAHPEIAEVAGEVDNTTTVDLFAADQPAAKNPSCYCPSNPASYELILDVLTEILDVFRPDRYVHLGHDEVYELGVCPTCRTKDPAQLFADEVNRLCAAVSERGLQSIIWADMLQPEAPYRTAAALDQLPDDLIMMDFIWYFHRERDTEPYLLDRGREVIIGNLYSSHYPRWEQRATRPGILGGQVSTWITLEDEAMAREGKYYDLAHVGIMLWSDRYHRHHRPSLATRIAPFLTDLRGRLTTQSPPTVAGPPVDLLAGAEPGAGVGRPFEDPVLAALLSRIDGPLALVGPAGTTTPYEITHPLTLPGTDRAVATAASVEFALPDDVVEIHLVHAVTRPIARVTWEPLTEIGHYRAVAADGTVVDSCPITPGGTVGHLHTRYGDPLPTSYYRHQGYTATYRSDPISIGQLDDGRDLCLYRTVWRLAEGGQRPVRISVEVDADAGTALVLAAAVGYRATDVDPAR